MKKLITICAAIFAMQFANAQNTFPASGSAGIGTTTPNSSAALDITSTTKGMLVPRMNKAKRDSIATPATGLLIYQTNATSGFYYYTGTAWKILGGSTYAAGTGINISGTTITNSSPDQVVTLAGTGEVTVTGTYPNFTVNAPVSGSSVWTTSGNNIYSSNSGNVGIGASSPVQKLDVNGNINMATGFGLYQNNKRVYLADGSPSGRNVFAGYQAGNSATGTYSSFLGYQSGYANTANYNTFLGAYSGRNNTTGTSNYFGGAYSGYLNTTGFDNSFLGYSAGYSNVSGNDNVFVGQSSGLLNTASDNTFVGSASGSANTTGTFNTFLGRLSGTNNLDGILNTFLGYQSGNLNSSGGYNTATGGNSLSSNSGGSYNTANGGFALSSNTSGSFNSAFGEGALLANVSGTNNTAIGLSALQSNTGSHNTAVGSNAAISNTTGENNVALGDNALFANTDGYYNTATGQLALSANVHGHDNTASGAKALTANTDGYYNSAFGSASMYKTQGGNNNTAVGFQSLHENTSGNYNVAIGAQTLFENISGNENTAVGYHTLKNTNGGVSNVGVGTEALVSNTTAGDNTAVGWHASYSNTIGTANTALGSRALFGGLSYSGNIAIGYGSGVSGMFGDQGIGNYNTCVGYQTTGNASGYDNSTALGNTATITASNQVRIGNSSVTSIGGYTGWTTLPSDKRFKKNIQENVPGLSFINQLKPVTYNLDLDAIDGLVQASPSQQDIAARNTKEQIVYTGFIAQDVETAARSIGYDFSGVDAPKNEKDVYGLRYAEFVVPLVKSVQELSKQNDDLKSQNESLQKQMDELKSSVANSQPLSNDGFAKLSFTASDEITLLGQNIPNPFDNSTLIPFRIPKNCHDASIMITNSTTSQVVTVIPVSCNETNVQVDAGTLSSGTYSYTLYVDGKMIDTKDMVLTK